MIKEQKTALARRIVIAFVVLSIVVSGSFAAGTLPVRNVVVILMESFAGYRVGALGSDADITLQCVPNLPGFEIPMQQAEGGHRFSGLPQLLGRQGFDKLYV